ncbi:hypothetical protein OSI85_24710, partial [Mycobacterium ulcerans]
MLTGVKPRSALARRTRTPCHAQTLDRGGRRRRWSRFPILLAGRLDVFATEPCTDSPLFELP